MSFNSDPNSVLQRSAEARNIAQTPVPNQMQRASDFGGLDPFAGEPAINVSIEQIINTELVLYKYERRMITKGEQDIWGVALLFEIHGDETRHRYKLLSWSDTLQDQAAKIPLEALPVLFQIEQKGSGNRKYWSMS